MPNVKVLIAEENNVELAYPQERLLHAQDMVFNPLTSGLTSTDVNSAIIEVKQVSTVEARFLVPFSYKGGADNRYLEFANLTSNNHPYFSPENTVLVSISAAVVKNKPCKANFTIYKNGVQVYVVNFNNVQEVSLTGLNISFSALDEISIYSQKLSGSANAVKDPFVNLYFKVV